ncbi:MAG: hypothetical protein M1814_003105 [Vezdaea aestivalis]|nr:MAG: hypothetical protein M1814_003105 [Vezdaea aestivalis]
MDETAKRAAIELGVANASTNVRTEFYKMLLYEEGAMFKPHKDTEKVPGMFGTLVICLPSEHIGGAVRLQHGGKSINFETSENSAFSASYIAWYTDITHEITPLCEGYRWVLTYNLINESKGPAPSALRRDVRIKSFTQMLDKWDTLQCSSPYLIYPLEHQYTVRDLKLGQLEGDDYSRALHISQSCEEADFYMPLANMTMNVVYPNDDDERNNIKTRKLELSNLVDTAGFSLLIYKTMIVSESQLLRPINDENRNPDFQGGGNYMGNSYAQIEQLFDNSAITIVPCFQIHQFLPGKDYSHEALYQLLRNLQTNLENKGDVKTLESLIFRLHIISSCRNYSNTDQKDLYLVPVAVVAALVEKRYYFSDAVEKLTKSFHNTYYSALGELINLRDLSAKEDDLVLALTKNEILNQTHKNVHNFYKGFCRGNANRSDKAQANFSKQWLCSLSYDCLSKFEKVYAEDAYTLVRIISEREEDQFHQFVIYQGVKTFVQRFKDNGILTNALIIELLIQPQHKNRSFIYIEALLKRMINAAICNFDFLQYALYIKTRDSKVFRNTIRDIYGESVEELGNLTGPIKAFYELASIQEQGISTRLLQFIQKQASTFIVEQTSMLSLEHLKVFIPAFLEEILPIIDCSCDEAHGCIQSLVLFYLTIAAGHEPIHSTSLAWPEGANLPSHSSCTCYDCLGMIAFFKHPELQRRILRPQTDCHLSSYFPFFECFDIEEADGKAFAVTKNSMKRWEKNHKEWETRSAHVLERLQKLPQDRLKSCLDHPYDEIMALTMFRVGRDKATMQKRHCEGTDFTELQKRQRINSQ